MTRKKRAHPPPKRTQITDSEGWTHISRSSNNKNIYAANAFTSDQKLLPAGIPDGQTLLDLQDSHAHYRDQWLSSPCHRSLQKLLQDDLPTGLQSRGVVDRCIVLGLGSLSNGRRSSWWELVFLETIVETLSPPSFDPTTDKKKNDEFRIYVQDPVFNGLDRAFLKSLGYAVLSDPEAFTFITRSTFLFAPHLETRVYMEALSKAKPRICVGTAIEECLDRVNYSRKNNHEHEPENEIFNGYRDSTESRSLPELDRDPWTQFTCLYWITGVDVD